MAKASAIATMSGTAMAATTGISMATTTGTAMAMITAIQLLQLQLKLGAEARAKAVARS